MTRFGTVVEYGGALAALCALLGSCGNNGKRDEVPNEVSGVTLTATDGITGAASSDDDSNGSDDTGPRLDLPGNDSGGGCNSDLGCIDKIDLLFVIDNSGSMAEEQLNLAKNFSRLIRRLEELTDSGGTPVNPDVQVMVTTTDYDNSKCRVHQPAGYTPAKGAPTITGCNARIGHFTGLGQNPVDARSVCETVCPNDLVPADPFIAFSFSTMEDNVPDVAPADIDGDGMLDSPVAQTLACIGPQGINGCGYEAPLETMIQALNPGQPWNSGNKPFLRPDALLAIAIVTDEADCSVKDYTIMDDPAYQEVDPSTGMKRDSSAICWNAGVTCTGPDAMGHYTDCHSLDDGKLQPTSRYTDYLVGQLRDTQHREVIMLGILGVPEVTAHNPEAPFNPIEGGELDLVYRDWRDGPYNPADPSMGGDLLPADIMAGKTAADKQFDFGIGPGCTGQDADGNFTGQAVPNTRVMEVCHALDEGDNIRCCIESICDDDFSSAIDCLTGIISEAIPPQG